MFCQGLLPLWSTLCGFLSKRHTRETVHRHERIHITSLISQAVRQLAIKFHEKRLLKSWIL